MSKRPPQTERMRWILLLLSFMSGVVWAEDDGIWDQWEAELSKYDSREKSPDLTRQVRRCTWFWVELPPENGHRVWSLREEACHLVDLNSDP